MVLCFEEKDRILIENEYGSIVEFKRRVYRITRNKELLENLRALWDKVKETIVRVINELFDQLYVGIKSLVDNLTLATKDFFEEFVDKLIEDPKERYQVVKRLHKAGVYNKQHYERHIYVNNIIQHHCRNNC